MSFNGLGANHAVKLAFAGFGIRDDVTRRGFSLVGLSRRGRQVILFFCSRRSVHFKVRGRYLVDAWVEVRLHISVQQCFHE